ncbi:Uu.00g031090.m01.CDS01 [Anthostomella pinea]|uniref:Uu.00g031090.m01.CDS01 n=1 Tax=Anthostomella pinea TaxID=933095 RepID=A0AAI8V8F5_9PEZI|nr:Uu.00g031090.m01.CDS01 [Anthostomella pinea]
MKASLIATLMAAFAVQSTLANFSLSANTVKDAVEILGGKGKADCWYGASPDGRLYLLDADSEVVESVELTHHAQKEWDEKTSGHGSARRRRDPGVESAASHPRQLFKAKRAACVNDECAGNGDCDDDVCNGCGKTFANEEGKTFCFNKY